MKRFLIIALLFLLAGFPMSADSIRAPKGFAGKLYAGTLAMYGQLGEKIYFLCTVEPYEKTANGYHLLTAGHCIQTNPIAVTYSVAEYIGGPRIPVTVTKAHFGDGFDFAILDLKTTAKYPLFELGDEKELRVGDRVISPNFSGGLVKQLSLGRVSSGIVAPSQRCPADSCSGDYMVQMDGGPGGSGSAVVSAKTHKVVGLLVWEFDERVGFGVEPISHFAAFLKAPNQPHPADDDI